MSPLGWNTARERGIYISLLSRAGDILPVLPRCRNTGFYIQAAFTEVPERRDPKLKPHCPVWARACCMSSVCSPSLSSTDCFPARTVGLTASGKLPARKQGWLTAHKHPPELGDSLPSVQVLVGAKWSERLFVSLSATKEISFLFFLFFFFFP